MTDREKSSLGVSTEPPRNSEQEGTAPMGHESAQQTPSSVLQQVEQKKRRRTRRRKPPEWAMRVVRTTQTAKDFFRSTLPKRFRRRRRELGTALVSFLVHLCVGLLLATWLLPDTAKNEMLQLIGARFEEEPEEQPLELVETVQPEEIIDLNVNSTMQQMLAELDKGQQRMTIDSPDLQELTLPLEDMADISDIPFVKGDFGGRSEAGRRAAVAVFGGNADSEKAVSQGLTWLQKIQRADGSWSFGDVGGAGQPGSLGTTDMGATALALLCFLGGGHTHETEGLYQETVRKGLMYLVKSAEFSGSGADLRGRFQANSGMYVQGIATIAVCEASALEPKDKILRRTAVEAVKFIEKAQNGVDGGWRYNPGDQGDTSVVGWQLMALQSAKVGRVTVQRSTIREAKDFLELVSRNDGALYAYMPDSGPSNSMTAVGLLCRMYLGWKRDNPALKAGVEHLAKIGPSRSDIYFNYYATQVMHHWGGELWKQWNLKLRDQLVESQIKQGPGAGSWDVTDSHGGAGGRIYQTTLSLLTLEVYYRHLPIYRRFDEIKDKETADAGSAGQQ